MSDELEAKSGQGAEEDEELMSDFQDLFEEDKPEAEGEAAGSTADTAQDDLDALLDDAVANIDVPDADASSDADETPVSDESGDELDELNALLDDVENSIDISDTDVDAGGSADEVSVPADADDLLELDASTEDDLMDLDDVMAEEQANNTKEAAEVSAPEAVEEAAVAAKVAAPAEPKPAPAKSAPSAMSPAFSRTQLIGSIAVISLGLLLSVAALWIAMSLGSQIETLNVSVNELEERLIAQSRKGSISPQAKAGGPLNLLSKRVDKLAVIVEGPLSHMQESNKALSMRIDRLEQGLPVITTAESSATPAPGSSTPLVKKAEPAAVTVAAKPAATKPLVKPVVKPVAKLVTKPVAKPVAKPAVAKPVVSKSGWVINLMSVSSAKTANTELARLYKLGIRRAGKHVVMKDGKTWYRLQVSGFDSYAGAKAYIDTVEKQTGFSSAWVMKEVK